MSSKCAAVETIKCALKTAAAAFAHPNVHESLPQPLNAFHSHHTTPQSCRVTCSVVCGNEVDIAARIDTRVCAAREKSFFP